ncbi:uncharacterized protein LOC129247116 [Anastrepha obliqua]|uniref:uncharacterized protein LOC129247116 n=1 Tax=Anastrepha obliqua TaxID=95512 RepID=UPI00240A0ED7|nr:uncharacterized protein LOC129247116 [Anastrepha obliqua]
MPIQQQPNSCNIRNSYESRKEEPADCSNSLDPQNLHIHQHENQVTLEEDVETEDGSDGEESEAGEHIANADNVTLCYNNNYYNNNNNYYYHYCNLNYNQHLNEQSQSKTHLLIRQLKRRTVQEILQRPFLIQIVALFMWFHGKFWQFYYETLTRRLQ